MLRRDFFKVGGMVVAALSLPKLDAWDADATRPQGQAAWIHGSPYLGHADRRMNFRGLSAEQIHEEIVHFHTAEPWRKRILFRL